jgi:hypothetical protein
MAIYQITCYAPATLEQSKKGYQCQAWEYEVQAATAEEALESHLNTPHFKTTNANLSVLLATEPVIGLYQLVA